MHNSAIIATSAICAMCVPSHPGRLCPPHDPTRGAWYTRRICRLRSLQYGEDAGSELPHVSRHTIEPSSSASASPGSFIRYRSSCLLDVIIAAAVASLSLGVMLFMSSAVANAWRIEFAVTGFPKTRLRLSRM